MIERKGVMASSDTTRPKRVRRHHIGLAGLFAIAIASLATTNCDNARCEDLRDELFAQKLDWQKCDVSKDCVIVSGNTGDCTGIMACNFAVNRKYRLDAARRVASLPEESVDCHKCRAPNCDKGQFVVCENVTQLCTIVEELVDGAERSVVYTTKNDPAPANDASAGGYPPDADVPDSRSGTSDGSASSSGL